MDEFIDVRIDVFEHTGQRARLQKNLTVMNLIEEVLKEFDDIVADSPEKYAVYLKGFDRPLTATQTLTQLDIQPQDELVFDYIRQTVRQMLDPRDYAILQEEITGKEFDIQWQPAVIGRPSNEMDHNITLAVNVQLLPNGGTISRSHAQITFSEGRYFIEPLTEYNPVILNGRDITTSKKQEIKNSDKLMLGSRRLIFTFKTQVSQKKSKTSSSPYKSFERIQKEVATPQYSVVDSSSLPEKPATLSFLIDAASDASVVGKRITIKDFPYLLGRLHPQLADENEVSRKHAEIIIDQNTQKFFITDLKSTNGVTIDGKSIPSDVPTELRSGCRVGLGSILVLRFEF